MLNKFFIFIYDNGIYDQEAYKYYLNNACQFDYYQDDMFRGCIGCSMFIDNKSGVLTGMMPVVPKMVDDVTTLINVYEYVHVLCAHKHLNKKYKKTVIDEVLPMYYEKLYVMENESEELSNFERELENVTLNSNDMNHLLALKLCYKLLGEKNYDDNLKKVSKRAKKLSKKIN